MSFHQERLEKIIIREVSTILMNSKDERLRFVIVTNAHLTGDLQIATIYYTVIGSNEQKESTIKNLEEAKGYVRSSLGKVLKVKKIPELIFKYDESLEYVNKIESILKGLNK